MSGTFTSLIIVESVLTAAALAMFLYRGVLDMKEWWFINPELTVHFRREARGEWICLDAATVIAGGGAGLARSTLSDTDGVVAHGSQSLLVAPRRPR